MQRTAPSQKILLIIGGVLCALLIFSVQLFLTLQKKYTRAASDELTQKTQAFTEQVKETLQEQK